MDKHLYVCVLSMHFHGRKYRGKIGCVVPKREQDVCTIVCFPHHIFPYCIMLV